MATPRKHPKTPEAKGDRTVTFINDQNREVEVVLPTLKHTLVTLRKQGYWQKSKGHPSSRQPGNKSTEE